MAEDGVFLTTYFFYGTMPRPCDSLKKEDNMRTQQWPVIIGDDLYLVDRTTDGRPAIYSAFTGTMTLRHIDWQRSRMRVDEINVPINRLVAEYGKTEGGVLIVANLSNGEPTRQTFTVNRVSYAVATLAGGPPLIYDIIGDGLRLRTESRVENPSDLLQTWRAASHHYCILGCVD